MINSIRSLFNTPYNKMHPFFALFRFGYWKLIRLFRMHDVPYKLWNDRTLYLNYDSFQSMWIMYNYWVDWEEFNLIKNYLREDDVVADIGANMGFYSIWMSKYISDKGKIYSFEPDDKNFERLKKNISVNNLNNIEVNKMAVSDIDGYLSFTTGLDGENHIVNNNDKAIKITGTKMDTFALKKQVSVFIYMKIDVEGFEYFLLKGAHELLSEKKIEILQLEINKTLSNSGVSIEELLQLIDNYQYTLCKYDVKKNKLIQITYSADRENYFAAYNLEKANERLK